MVSQFNATNGILWDGVLLKNGTVDVNGSVKGIIFDADGDTYMSASTDNQLDVFINGALDFNFTPNAFNVLSGSAIAGPSSMFVPFIPIAVQQDLSGAGAINVTSLNTLWTTTGADAGTMIDGVVKGHLKTVTMIVDGGDGTLTPSNLNDGSTVTFADAGDSADFVWTGSAWTVLKLYNITDGATAPVLA